MICPPKKRRELVERDHAEISLSCQIKILGISRSSLYYEPRPLSSEDKEFMDLIDEIYTERPFYGKRRICWALRKEGFSIGIKRTRSLMRRMRI